jgi:hypothetical protein
MGLAAAIAGMAAICMTKQMLPAITANRLIIASSPAIYVAYSRGEQRLCHGSRGDKCAQTRRR